MKECERFREKLSAMLDGELTAAERAEAKAHLAGCAECRALYEAFADVSGAMEPVETPDTLHDGVMAKLRMAEKARKTQKRLAYLRTVLTAAACLAVIVSAVLTARAGVFSRESAAANGAALRPSQNTSTSSATSDNAAYAVTSGMAVAAPAAAEEEAAEEPELYAMAQDDGAEPYGLYEDMDAPSAEADTADAEALKEIPEMRADAPDDIPEERPAMFAELEVRAQAAEGFSGVILSTDAEGILSEGDEVLIYTEEGPGFASGDRVTVRFQRFSTAGGATEIFAESLEIETGPE